MSGEEKDGKQDLKQVRGHGEIGIISDLQSDVRGSSPRVSTITDSRGKIYPATVAGFKKLEDDAKKFKDYEDFWSFFS